MSLESVFKLSLVMNMVDHLTGPMANVSSNVGNSVSKLQGMNQTLGSMTKTGAAMAGIGAQITDAALSPVKATFETREALGELSSLGVKDLGTIEDAAKSFSNQWAGTTKSDFISAAYDIKSGISSLSDEGVAQMTNLSGLTAKATKSTVGEMTSLFATGYGIYKDYYSNMSDLQFGEMFSAGISQSVKQFKTTGSGMAQAIENLGASATNAKVPLEEQLSILGMLQGTMSGSEAGTKYNAFLRSAAKGGKELGLKFTDANNQLLSMPEILDKLRGKFGDTMDAAEKMQLQKAFGDTEAVSLVDLMYNKVGDLQGNIVNMYSSLGQGTKVTKEMASAMNKTEPERFEVLKQRIHNVAETIGNGLLPTINQFLSKGDQTLTKVSGWISKNQDLVRVIMLVVLTIGGFLAVGGTTIAVVGSVGLIFTKTAGMIKGFVGAIKGIPSILETIQIKGLYAGDSIKGAFSTIGSLGSKAAGGIKTAASAVADFAKQAAAGAANGLKNFATGIGDVVKGGARLTSSLAKSAAGFIKMGAQAAASAIQLTIQKGASLASAAAEKIQAAAQWLVNAAMNANPIGIVIALILALVAAFAVLWNKCKPFRDFWISTFTAIGDGFKSFINMIISGLNMLISGLDSFKLTMPSWMPIVGGKTLGFSIPQIPKLAKGGVVNEATSFVAGEHGREAVMPLENNTGWIDNLAKSLSHKTASLPQRPAKKIKLSSRKKEEDEDEGKSSSSNGAKNVIIKKLLMQVDLKQIKDLQKLLKLLGEVEDYTNGNGDEEDDDSDGDLTATPEPA